MTARTAPRRRWIWWTAFGVVTAMILVVGLHLGLTRSASGVAPVDGQPRIAILPFDDLSVGEDRGYLSDAIAEGLITELARSPYFTVTARNSSFRYRGTPTDVRRIGRELGVQYVVEGSQQKNGNKLRVTAQLISTDDARHLWAQTYDVEIGDFFVMQDRLVRTLTDRLGRRVTRALPVRDDAAVSALHYRLVGKSAMRQDFSAASNEIMRETALKAIAIDPRAHHGYLNLGWHYRHLAVFGWGELTREEALTLAETNADAAIALGPEDHRTHYLRARLHVERGELKRANLLFEKAIGMNPSDSDVVVASTSPLLYMGRADEAIERIRAAMGIDPFHRDWFHWQMGWAFWEKGECDAALTAMQRMSPIPKGAHRMLAGIHACLSNAEAAREALAVFMADAQPTTLTAEREKWKDLWTAPGVRQRP